MKRILLSLVAIATISLTSFGQAPEAFKYQAVIRDGSSLILTNQAVGMQLMIRQVSAGGPAVYTETFAITTNAYGLVNLEIGSGTPVSGDFTTIDWANGPYFIETAVDVTGGTSYAVMGTSQLMSVPYALYAKTSGSSTSACGLSIGDTYAGGIIFFLDGSGCHGLVAKATDEPGFYQWSPTDFSTWAFASGIYGGAQNTKKSIARAAVNFSTCPAASVCDNLTSGGYTDWYLPSKDELDMVYVNLYLQGLGGFASSVYWSSTEYGNANAWGQNFTVGNQDGTSKTGNFYVRAVRAF